MNAFRSSEQANTLTRRHLLKLVGISLVGAIAGACAPKAEPTAGAAAATEAPAPTKPAAKVAPVKITAGAWAIATYAELQGESYKRFSEQSEAVDVEWLQMPWADYWTKMTTLLAAGAAPEISLYTPETFLDHAARSAIRSLDSLIDRDGYDLSDFYKVLVDMSMWKGKMGAIPAYHSPIVCFYNKTILSEAGAEFPKETWTWADLREAALKATDADKGIWGFGLEREMWAPIIWSNGGEVWNDDFSASRVDEEVFVNGLQWWGDLRNVDHVAPSPAEMADMKTEMLFQTGKLTMVFHPLSRSIPWVDAKVPFEWDLGWAPKGDQGRSLRLGAGVWGITKDCKPELVDAAWDAIKWVSGPEEGNIWAGLHINVPARKSVAESPAFLDTPPPESLGIQLEMMPYARMPYKLPGSSEWWNNILSNGVILVELGEEKAADQMQEVKKLLDQWLVDNPMSKWTELV